MDEPIEGEIVDPNEEKVYEMSYDGRYRKGYIVEEWQNDEGHRIVRYESGMVKDTSTNQIIKPVDRPYFTKENNADMIRLRKEKVARRIREEISRAMFGKEFSNRPSESVGIAAGMLWTEIVMNKNALPRDRLNAYVALGKHAGLLDDLREGAPAPEGVKVEIGQNLAREIVQKLMDKKRDE